MSLIWFIFFFLNIVILFVVLMNFLIAIVSETYASVMEAQTANVYFYRAALNKEHLEIFGEPSTTNDVDQVMMISKSENSSLRGFSDMIKSLKEILISIQNN